MGPYTGSLHGYRCFLVWAWLALPIERLISAAGSPWGQAAGIYWDISSISHFQACSETENKSCEHAIHTTRHLSLTNPLLLINVQVWWSCRWGWFEPWPCSCWSSWGRPRKSAGPASFGRPPGGLPPPGPPSPSPPSAWASPTGASGQTGWLRAEQSQSQENGYIICASMNLSGRRLILQWERGCRKFNDNNVNIRQTFIIVNIMLQCYGKKLQ